MAYGQMKALEGKLGLAPGTLEPYPSLLCSLLADQEFMPLIRSTERSRHRAEWREFLRAIQASPPSSAALAEAFHTQWHVCHHRLRELVEDDELLLDVAWVWLPRYEGPGRELYRGENIDRFEEGRIGSAWSDRQETASMFASGLNAVGKGGVVLRVHAPAETIIAGPSKHSQWLNESEFAVDIRLLPSDQFIEIERHACRP